MRISLAAITAILYSHQIATILWLHPYSYCKCFTS